MTTSRGSGKRPHPALALVLLCASGVAEQVVPPAGPEGRRADHSAALPITVLPARALRPVPPQVEHENGVAWVTGGVGIAQRQQTIEAGRDMNLQLVFTRMPDAIYLAGVAVTIEDRSGREVLAVDAADPLLFAQLPPGVYRVTARFGGQSIERRVRVPAKGQHTEFMSWRDRARTAGR